MNIVRRHQIPLCHICGHQVEKFTRVDDVRRCMTIYTAECHGATETVELACEVLMTAGPDGITVTEAFAGLPLLTDAI